MDSARIRKWSAAVAVVGLLAAVPAGAKERGEAKRLALGERWVAAWSEAVEAMSGWLGFKDAGECGSMIDPYGRCQTTMPPATQNGTTTECGSAIDPGGSCHQ